MSADCMNHDVSAYSVKLCRACLGDREDMQDIFKACFSEIFFYCTSLEVSEDDGLPSSLCQNCIALLNTFYYFKQQCVRSDGTLRQIIPQTTENIKQEESVVEIKFDMKFDVGSQITETQTFIEVETEVSHFDCPDNLSFDHKNLESDLTDPISQEKSNNGHLENLKSHHETANEKKLHFPSELFKLKCEICSEGFTKTTLLRKHVKEKHFEDAKWQEKCKPSTERKPAELVRQTTPRALECPKCDKKFKLSHRLNAHVRQHYGLKPFDCKVCHKELSNWRTLKMHMNRHNGQRNYVCNVCQEAFTYPTVLEIHKKIHLGVKNYHCNMCHAGFIQSGQLKSHMRTHTTERPFQCTLCDKRFKSGSALKVHEERHTGTRNFVCSVCGKRFPTSGELTTHARSHTNDRPFACGTCPKSFRTRSLLGVHMRTHTGERPYKCQSCPKRFSTSQLLKRHRLIHSGVKPHACHFCRRGFTQKSALKTHMKCHRQIFQGVHSEALESW